MAEQITQEQDAPKLDPTIRMDEALFFAAKADVEFVRREYLSAMSALEKAATGENEIRQQRERLDRARSRLAQSLTILDMSRGDGTY